MSHTPLVRNFSINYTGISIPFSVGYEELIDFYKNLEPQTKNYYCDVVKPGWNIIDTGANIGMFTLLFSKLTKGRVWAIEASEQNFNMLCENVSKTDFATDNVTLLRNYVSNHSGVDTGEIHFLWTGRGSVLRENGQFNFTTLDDLIGLEQPVHLIKIDIDGYDFEAIQGATKILERYKPLVVIELVTEALQLHGYSPQNVLDFMAQHNYRNTGILDNCNYIFEFNN